MDEAVVAKETLPALEGGMEDGLLVVLEVWDLQGQVPDRPSELAVAALVGRQELVLDPLVRKPADESGSVVPPHPSHEDVGLVMGWPERTNPDKEHRRPTSTSGEVEEPGQARGRPARAGKNQEDVGSEEITTQRKGRRAKDAAMGRKSSPRRQRGSIT